MFIGRNGGCENDNFTIKFNSVRYVHNFAGTYCGTEIPKVMRIEGIVNISFQTDKYIQKRGFIMHYEIEGIPIFISIMLLLNTLHISMIESLDR